MAIWLDKKCLCVLGLLLSSLAAPAWGGSSTTFDENGNGAQDGAALIATPIPGGGIEYSNTPSLIPRLTADHPNFLIYEPDGVTASDLVQFRTVNGSVVMDFYSLGSGHEADVAALPFFDPTNFLTATEAADGIFRFTNPFGFQGVSADDSILTPVPEPSSIFLLCAGLVAMGWAFRRTAHARTA